MRRRAALILATTGTMLLMACGLALAAQVISCQPGKANCNGTAKSDTIKGSNAGDRISGKDGRDSMVGNMGRDTMDGGKASDRMRGSNAADTLTGGPGSDNINAGAGNDVVFADDGELDSISCGLGDDDIVFVDQADLDAEGTNIQDFVRLTSCETINEPSSEEPPIETASTR